MIIRRPKVTEWQKLRDIHASLQGQFIFPDFSDISSVFVAVEDEEIIGFGALLPIYEAVLVLDQTKDRSVRAKALSLLHDKGNEELKAKGVNQMHIFVQNKSFLNYMKKRFNYIYTKGTALVRKVG